MRHSHSTITPAVVRHTAQAVAQQAFPWKPYGRLVTVASGGLTTGYGYDAASDLTTTTLPSAGQEMGFSLTSRASSPQPVPPKAGTRPSGQAVIPCGANSRARLLVSDSTPAFDAV